MSLFPGDSTIFGPLFADPAVAAIFADEELVSTLLHVEATLARVQGELGVIPSAASATIAATAPGLSVDLAHLREGTEKAGIPIVALVQQLRQHVGEEAASYVHWGATSQDILDTALVLQLRAALELIAERLEGLVRALAGLAAAHRHTVLAGRTHAQQALPITFGLKVAGWLAPLLRQRQRLQELKPRLFVVQFGGGAGTLASLGGSGRAVQDALAAALDLGVPTMPWHTQRDGLAEVAGWLSLLSGSLAKMAQDVILMAQSEIGEVRETSDPERGGSSTMPQKRNPIISELIVTAARSNATLLSSMHQALIQEHERATHGWQLEWATLPQMVALTASAVSKARFLGEHLVVDEGRMQQNVAASRGQMMAEAISFALAPTMGRGEAKRVVREACLVAVAEGRHLVDVVREKVDAPVDWQALRAESNYLGSAQAFIERVLEEAGAVLASPGAP